MSTEASLTEALLHFPGIGPVRLARLHERGIRRWSDLLEQRSQLPPRLRDAWVAEATRCTEAWERRDIAYLVEALHPKDKWRLLAHFCDHTTFFDIETSGLDYDAEITVIGCWHRGSVHTFVADHDLDRFLELLDEVQLLASFNGNSFDVPRVLDAFHIPRLPCPHLDLRWTCYHQGYAGGLKQVAQRLGIVRPIDLSHADGALAVRLWARWRTFGDIRARQELLRYCASDALLLRLLAERLAGNGDYVETARLWEMLPIVEPPPEGPSQEPQPVPEVAPFSPRHFGAASPARLRGLRRWR